MGSEAEKVHGGATGGERTVALEIFDLAGHKLRLLL